MAGPDIEREAGTDKARIVELARLLGSQRLGELFDILHVRLSEMMTRFDDPSNCLEMIDVIHQSQGSASSLGLSRVASSLGRIEILMRQAVDDPTRSSDNPIISMSQLNCDVSMVISELREDQMLASKLSEGAVPRRG